MSYRVSPRPSAKKSPSIKKPTITSPKGKTVPINPIRSVKKPQPVVESPKEKLVNLQEIDTSKDKISPITEIPTSKELEVEQEPNLSKCFRGCGIFFSIVLIFFSVVYLGSSVLCCFDRRGKQVYFEEDPNEYSFLNGMIYKTTHPTWTIKTEDWGYIRRAFDETKDNSKSYWKDYDVMIAMVVTGGVTGIFFLVSSFLNLFKFLRTNWKYSYCGIFL